MKTTLSIVAIFVCAWAVSSCSSDVSAMTPQSIEQQYGVPGAYTDSVATSDGSLKGTVVPVTLADGRTAQLFIPGKAANQPHAVYLRDADGLHPVRVKDHVTHDQITQAAAVMNIPSRLPLR
jgi:hypothetical protein